MRAVCLLTTLAAVLGVALVTPALAVTDAERVPVYHEFRSLFDARRYDEALPLAEKLVQLTEEQYGRDDARLVTPLVNLATTRYRLHDFDDAEKLFLRSISILETSGTPQDRRLIRPLHGLGASCIAKGSYEAAAVALKRAVDLSRNLDGLFNPDQLPVLDRLIEAYVALGQVTEAEKEQQYALRIAETAYGRWDLRLLQPLDRHARWFESVGRYATARSLHLRALAIAEQAGRGQIASVAPLRGIARTYRLEFANGVDSGESTVRDPLDASSMLPDAGASGRMSAEGERALLLALQVLERSQPPDRRLHGETLVDLGDWYLTGAAATRAIQIYEKAWADLSAGGDTTLLAMPEQLVYRPPSSSISRTRLDPGDYEVQTVELRLTIGPDGKVGDAVAQPGTAASEATVRAVVAAARKARYRPRFEAGKAVDTRNVALRERMAVRVRKTTDRQRE